MIFYPKIEKLFWLYFEENLILTKEGHAKYILKNVKKQNIVFVFFLLKISKK